MPRPYYATYEIAVAVLGAGDDYVTAVLAGDVSDVVDLTPTVPREAVELVEAGVGYDAGMEP